MIKNINVSISETGAAEVTASVGQGKLIMTVIVHHITDDSWRHTKYAVSTNEGFSSIGDEWDVTRSIEKQGTVVTAMFAIASKTLEITNPMPKVEESTEEVEA